MIGVLLDIIPASRMPDLQPKRWAVLMCDPVTRAVECISLIENEQAEAPPFGCEPASDIQSETLVSVPWKSCAPRRSSIAKGIASNVPQSSSSGPDTTQLRYAQMGSRYPSAAAVPKNVRSMSSSFVISVHRVSARQSMPRAPRCRCSQKPGAWIWLKHEHRFDDGGGRGCRC